MVLLFKSELCNLFIFGIINKNMGELMKHKQFLTIDEQIAKLKTLGINVSNNTTTKKILSENSFYNILNGYREPFLFMGVSNRYVNHLNFLELYGLYSFDRQLRNTLFPFILDIENKIKSETIYEFSNTRDTSNILIHGTDSYLRIDSYDITRSRNNAKFKAAIDLISSLQKNISKNFKLSESISHYLTNYAYVPLWVLSTHMTFSDISKFYSCMKPQNRQNVSKKYQMTDSDLITILKLLTKARNSCAHGNRIYCLKTNDLPTPNSTLYPKQYSFITSTLGEHKLFNVIIAIKYFIPKKRYKALMNSIETLFKDLDHQLKTIPLANIHNIMGFPTNWYNLVD